MLISEIDPGEKVKFDPIHSEHYANFDDNDFARYIKLIKKDCSQALSIMLSENKMLYRGFNDCPAPCFKGMTRNDRQSLAGTDPEVLDRFNQYLIDNGSLVTRKNSISTTSNENETARFGTNFYLFPLNGFKFLWSPKIQDFGNNFNDLLTVYDSNSISGLKQISPENQIELFQKLKFTNKDFGAALESGNEISISGEYYAFKANIFADMIQTLWLS